MPKDKKEHVEFQQAFFDHNVNIFKKPIPEDVLERSREIIKAIIADCSVRILDVGTGIGAFLQLYSEYGIPFSNILGCDLSTEMLAEARLRFPEVQFWQGDILELPLEFGTFDLVVFNACFGNIFDQLAVLNKSCALLNEKGRIAISHPMGNEFVRQLKETCPDLVFTLMPERQALENWAQILHMSLIEFRDERQLYLALFELD